MCGLKTRAKPEQHEQDLGGEVDRGEADVDPGGLLDPDDVERDEDHDHDGAADDVPRVLLQRLPEDREVVGHEERRDGDRDDVVEHLRPGRRERDELVEGVPREARGAARLREAHRPLGVRRSGRREEEAGDHEDDGRQPEREEGGYAEGVVDRGADVAVRGGEERVRPENALELVRLATPPCHGVTVEPAAVAPAPATGPVAIITRHGASRSSRRISRGKARWKPRRDSTGAPTTTSSARRSAATRATSSPKLPGRVRTISRRTATPYEVATALATSSRSFRLTSCPSRCALIGSSRSRTAGATSTIRAPRSAARRQARSTACSVSSRSSSGTTMLR